MNLTNVSVSCQLASKSEITLRPLLGAHLEYPAVPANSIPHRLAFGNSNTCWLFTVHIFAGLCCGSGNQRVPVVLGSNHHCIDVLTGKQLTEITEGRTSFVAVMLVNEVLCLLTPVSINIANSNHPNSRIIQECFCIVCALPAGADASHYDTIGRSNVSGFS